MSSYIGDGESELWRNELIDSDGEYDIEEPLPPSRPQSDDLNTNDELILTQIELKL